MWRRRGNPSFASITAVDALTSLPGTWCVTEIARRKTNTKPNCTANKWFIAFFFFFFLSPLYELVHVAYVCSLYLLSATSPTRRRWRKQSSKLWLTSAGWTSWWTVLGSSPWAASRPRTWLSSTGWWTSTLGEILPKCHFRKQNDSHESVSYTEWSCKFCFFTCSMHVFMYGTFGIIKCWFAEHSVSKISAGRGGGGLAAAVNMECRVYS